MRARWLLLTVGALVAGLGIAGIDSSPGWDDTGITAVLLVVAAFGVTILDPRRRAWWWTILVGLPTPLLEIPAGGSNGAWLAVVFAGVGAVGAWAIRGRSTGSTGDTPA
jgi:hypothetical protein